MGRLNILFQAQSGRVGIQIQSSAKHEHVQVSPFISHCFQFPSNWKIFTQKLCKKEIVVRVSLLDTNIQAPGQKKAPGRSAKESRHGLKTFHACSMSPHITDRFFCKHLSISTVSSQFFTKPSRANYLFPTTICPWLLVIYDYRHKTHRYSLAFASRSSSTTTLNL